MKYSEIERLIRLVKAEIRKYKTMKKLILFTAICLMTLSAFGQRTSEDVKNQILSTIGSNIIKATPELNDLFVLYKKLYTKETRMLPELNKIGYQPNLHLEVCWICVCPHCGCTVLQGNGNCSLSPSGCHACPCCGWGTESYVMSCLGGMCGNIQG
jgi:hypothetical protein